VLFGSRYRYRGRPDRNDKVVDRDNYFFGEHHDNETNMTIQDIYQMDDADLMDAWIRLSEGDVILIQGPDGVVRLTQEHLYYPDAAGYWDGIYSRPGLNPAELDQYLCLDRIRDRYQTAD
jgi:hypothetical protein